MTDVDMVMNPEYLGNDPTDIRIRIWINPESGFKSWITSD